ncbi:hypothetical protein FHS23_000946 [Prauserella isguenensis]|uniref:Uncharacterized protein n=1 Tax=Prauserella isguenensis TaxID=1470180 RepID=A0A839RW40_9PSEU|nr:hypothetical protein [Prauserella isguenensis]
MGSGSEAESRGSGSDAAQTEGATHDTGNGTGPEQTSGGAPATGPPHGDSTTTPGAEAAPSGPAAHPTTHDTHAEAHHQRLTRNVNELLGELRVAQAGVQILFGFLLAVAFTAQFREASGFEKILHLVTVLFAAAATALLTAPAAWHRMLFRTGRRQTILRVGNRLVIAGLVCLAIAVTLTVGLIAKVVYGPVLMAVAVVLIGGLFSTLWFLIPTKL